MTDTKRQLEILIIKYSPLLHSLVRKHITTDYHDGWDAYQDICLHLWEYIPRTFDPDRGNLFVYFRKSVLNTVISYRKRRRCRRPEPPIYREHFTDRLRGIIRDQDNTIVEYLMKRADTSLKQKLLCLCLDGYTPTEMMLILKISRSSVYNYLNYFRRIIQEYKNVYF